MDLRALQEDTVIVAQELIGCYLVRQTPEGTMKVRITETEAYKGENDPASHAYKGVTPRSAIMFGEVGKLYVYMIYGMHYCMNIVAHVDGEPGAVLIRAAECVDGIELLRKNRPKVSDKMLLNGPAKLAQALKVDLSMNGLDLLEGSSEPLILLPKDNQFEVRSSTRIGISKGKELMWRFEAVGP